MIDLNKCKIWILKNTARVKKAAAIKIAGNRANIETPLLSVLNLENAK